MPDSGVSDVTLRGGGTERQGTGRTVTAILIVVFKPHLRPGRSLLGERPGGAQEPDAAPAAQLSALHTPPSLGLPKPTPAGHILQLCPSASSALPGLLQGTQRGVW